MPTEDEVEWVVDAVTEIRTAMGTDQKTADAIGLSRNGWKKWQTRSTYPTEANIKRIRGVLEQVRARATKVTGSAPLGSRAPLRRVSSGTRGTGAATGERAKMVALLASLGRSVSENEPTYVLELEICLWYHRDEVADGGISQTAIAAAREGFFEDRGCEAWSAMQWWAELRAYDGEVRGKLRRLKPRSPGGEPSN